MISCIEWLCRYRAKELMVNTKLTIGVDGVEVEVDVFDVLRYVWDNGQSESVNRDNFLETAIAIAQIRLLRAAGVNINEDAWFDPNSETWIWPDSKSVTQDMVTMRKMQDAGILYKLMTNGYTIPVGASQESESEIERLYEWASFKLDVDSTHNRATWKGPIRIRGLAPDDPAFDGIGDRTKKMYFYYEDERDRKVVARKFVKAKYVWLVPGQDGLRDAYFVAQEDAEAYASKRSQGEITKVERPDITKVVSAYDFPKGFYGLERYTSPGAEAVKVAESPTIIEVDGDDAICEEVAMDGEVATTDFVDEVGESEMTDSDWDALFNEAPDTGADEGEEVIVEADSEQDEALIATADQSLTVQVDIMGKVEQVDVVTILNRMGVAVAADQLRDMVMRLAAEKLKQIRVVA